MLIPMRSTVVLALFVFALGCPTARAQVGGGRMHDARLGHAIVALADGGALVAGGQDARGVALASAEVLEGGRWSAAAPLDEPRAWLTLTPLADGRVLATGGRGASEPLASTELWDPATGRWSAAAPMHDARASHMAVQLADGRVLVAGGRPAGDAFWTASAELWDPVRDVWTRAAPMSAPRQLGTAARLGDGRVIVAGSYLGGERADDLDLYDPAHDTWVTLRGPLGQLEAVVALADGRALVLGHGRPSRYVADSRDARAAIWDPTSGTWSDVGSTGERPWPHHASLLALANGDVVVAGGQRWEFPSAAARRRAEAEACEGLHVPLRSVREVRVWRALTGTWRRVADLRQPRSSAAATLLGGDTVLIAGGQSCRFDGCGLVRRSVERLRP